jgi:hypothetical protein
VENLSLSFINPFSVLDSFANKIKWEKTNDELCVIKEKIRNEKQHEVNVDNGRCLGHSLAMYNLWMAAVSQIIMRRLFHPSQVETCVG